MAIKVIAQRRELKIGKNPGVKKFVMRPDLYIPIAEKKVFAEASTHSGISAGVIKAAWDAAGEVIRTWATEGHSIPIPGLGTMRFGVRSKSVEKLEDVKTGLITTRRIVFTPNVEVKEELKNTSIQITCLDEEGNVLKRVTSGDSGEVEDPENGGSEGGENQNGSQTLNLEDMPVDNELDVDVSAPGEFIDSLEVSITAPEGAVVHYTTDGTNPTLESPIYTGPFTITETTKVSAFCVKDGKKGPKTSCYFTKKGNGTDQ